jgi:methionyl-tRNA formyltransferase
MGTGPFAVPMFRELLASPHDVLALVTRPDRPVHRRGKAPENPMRETARAAGLEVFEPESINSTEAIEWLRRTKADLFIVCDYGQILSREALSQARLGGINLHASLLPKYRGAAPINWAVYHGESETGVTVIHMTPQLDAGPCLVQHRTEIGSHETAPELESRLSDIGVAAVMEAIDLLAIGSTVGGIEQDPQSATRAPRLKKEDGLVDWSRSPTAIFNQVRAFQPWPKTHTFWQRPEHEPLRLILEQVEPTASDAEAALPGVILEADNDRLVVACGEGSLKIEAIQPAGKRAMSAAEFLHGHPLAVGQRLG